MTTNWRCEKRRKQNKNKGKHASDISIQKCKYKVAWKCIIRSIFRIFNTMVTSILILSTPFYILKIDYIMKSTFLWNFTNRVSIILTIYYMFFIENLKKFNHKNVIIEGTIKSLLKQWLNLHHFMLLNETFPNYSEPLLGLIGISSCLHPSYSLSK